MWHTYGTKSSIPCCKSASTIASVPADLNGLNMPSARLIFV